jgi:hypothetical protein
VAYILGCATGDAVNAQPAQTATPTPAAAAPTTTGGTRWEYQCTEGRNIRTMHERFAPLGAEGWELAASGMGTVGVWCFKRPMS